MQKSMCESTENKKNQYLMLVSLQLIWYIFILIYVSKSTQIMTPTDEEPKENWLVAVRSCKVEVIENCQCSLTESYRWLTEGTYRTIVIQSIIFVVTRVCFLIPQRKPMLGINLESIAFFSLLEGKKSYHYLFHLKAKLIKSASLNQHLDAWFDKWHLLCKYINHLDLQLKEG